tara:strand:- start:807 stop:956 length:150 start_codon:yes stop_codon:yes gene_type:complete
MAAEIFGQYPTDEAFHPFLPLRPLAMRGDSRLKGDSLTAGQERSVKAKA